MEMERFYGKAKEDDQGALALVLDLAKAFERVSLLVVRAGATHFSFPRRSCECCAGTSSTDACTVRRMCGRAAILRLLLQGAFKEITNIYPPLKLRVFVDDITAQVMERRTRKWLKRQRR